MKKLKPFLLGVFTTLGVLSLIAYITFKTTTGSSNLEIYPMGSGRHQKSPNNQWVAHASNMVDKTFNGSIIEYFEFKIVDPSNGETIISHRFPQRDSNVIFRQGNGTITWSPDSKEVFFGSNHEKLWNYKIPDQSN